MKTSSPPGSARLGTSKPCLTRTYITFTDGTSDVGNRRWLLGGDPLGWIRINFVHFSPGLTPAEMKILGNCTRITGLATPNNALRSPARRERITHGTSAKSVTVPIGREVGQLHHPESSHCALTRELAQPSYRLRVRVHRLMSSCCDIFTWVAFARLNRASMYPYVALRCPTYRENSHANHTWHPPSQ